MFSFMIIMLKMVLMVMVMSHLKKNGLKQIIIWFVYLVLMLIGNQKIAHGDYISVIRIVLCLLVVLVGVQSTKWIESVIPIIIAIGFPNVIATFVFYFSDGLYQRFISMTYKTYQSGTKYGAYGYRAALADHYSQNGTYISMVVITLGAVLIAGISDKKKRKYCVVCEVLAMIALLLTTKRAHLLFSVAALLLVYTVVNKENVINRTFKLLLVLVITIVVGSVAFDMIPQLASVFDRLQNVGTDTSSMARIAMWKYTWEVFKQNPILGIGWSGITFSSVVSTISGFYAGSHNIYLQLLAERGIIGFLVFAFAAFGGLFQTLQNIKEAKNENTKQYVSLVVSLIIQLFCLMYGLTGNMIYDRTFHFYICAVAVNLSYSVYKHQRHM